MADLEYVGIDKEDWTGVKTEWARSERELILGPTY